MLLRLLTRYLSYGGRRHGRRRHLLHSHIAVFAHQNLSLRGIFVKQVVHSIACPRERTGAHDAMLRLDITANLMLDNIFNLQMLAHDRLALKHLLLPG